MRNLGTLIVVAILLTLLGCCVIRSLHPLYTDQDVIFSSDLLGCWSEEVSHETWEFSKQSESEYQLVITENEGSPFSYEKGKSGTFITHLLKIKGEMFLDLSPSDPEFEQHSISQFCFLPVHTFAYVKQIKPTLQMSFPEPDWLEKLITDNPEAIRHEKIDDEIILTASTKELQTFWLKHLDTRGAFGELTDMKRK
jgi:hypothetical protein